MTYLTAIAVLSWTLATGTGAEVPSSPVHGPSPLAQLVHWTDAVKTCVRRSYPSWSPEAELQRSEIKRLVGGSMDYAEMSRRALGKHWEHLSNEERSEFVADLGRLIESRYLVRGMYLGPDCQIRFDRESIAPGGTATVFATVLATRRKKTLRMTVEYRLLREGDRWVVYDLVTDGKSLLDNYRSQFDKVIARESFSALLQKIRQRTNRGDQDVGQATGEDVREGSGEDDREPRHAHE